jgi:hypothetical protein
VAHDLGPNWLGKKQDPISKITNTKRTGRVVQVSECLHSKHEVGPEFNPITTKEKEREKLEELTSKSTGNQKH